MLVSRIFALVLHFNCRSLLSATDHLGGPVSPVLGKPLEVGKSERLRDFGDDPWNFAIRLR